MLEPVKESAARENIKWFEQQISISTDEREQRLLWDLLIGEVKKLQMAPAGV